LTLGLTPVCLFGAARGRLVAKPNRLMNCQWVVGKGAVMSNDRERGVDEGVANKPEEIADIKQRENVGRFAKYTAPAMLALLLGDRMAAAVTFK
jgi:hypothetical protein